MHDGGIATDRIDLVPVTPAMLDALIDDEPRRLERLVGARFGLPLRAPPLFGEHAAFFRSRMVDGERLRRGRDVADPESLAWRFWFLIARDQGRVVGVAGLPGVVLNGSARIGYSIYPDAQGRGYASEAVAGLVEWLLARPEVTRVRATIAPANAASLEVARRAGMHEMGTTVEDGEEMLVLERSAPGGAAGAGRGRRGVA